MIRTSKPSSMHRASNDLGDPLLAALRPPPGETEEERRQRLAREMEAKRVSDKIDEEIKQDEKRFKKRKQDVKLLLLGQAESGKSTLQKQFRLMNNPNSLDDERQSWRTVVYYNIARPVRRIFEIIDIYGEDDDDDTATEGHSGIPQATLGEHASSPRVSSPTSEKQLANLRLRLSPLLAAESSLAHHLSDDSSPLYSTKSRVLVRAGWQARSLLSKVKSRADHSDVRPSLDNAEMKEEFNGDGVRNNDAILEEVGNIVHACKDDVKELWEHPVVRRLREKRRLRLEEWAEFFLDNISRVSAPGYVPTTDDILHARIQTMGVSEHTFDFSLHGKTVTWHLYDVGGARGQRHTWIPYFDDASAIIFMAPVSAFDQYLEEDPRTNRIDDSLQLFTQICANPLLKRCHLVLFLNKTDVLTSKLARGIRVKKYITSYGERPNDFDSIVNYFRAHFLQVHKRNNENNRVLYTHLTNVVDKTTTHRIITNVRDSIFRVYLQSAALV